MRVWFVLVSDVQHETDQKPCMYILINKLEIQVVFHKITLLQHSCVYNRCIRFGETRLPLRSALKYLLITWLKP